MVIKVRLFATFREGRFKKKEIEFSEAGSLSGLLGQLEIPEESVGVLLVNGKDAGGDYKLAANDVVSIFPLIGGG